jgi:hypothetical protein
MPRASWRGFLRLSLVSCPIYLSPATTRAKPIRLHQVWRPAPVNVDEDDLPHRSEGQQASHRLCHQRCFPAFAGGRGVGTGPWAARLC